MAYSARLDENSRQTLTAVSSSDGSTITSVYVDPTTHALSVTATSMPAAAATGGGSYTHIAAGQATTVVKASAGTLYAIVFNSPAAATNVTTVYDNASGSGTVIAIPLTTGVTVPTMVTFGSTGLAFANGLTIITTTANGGDMTIIWK